MAALGPFQFKGHAEALTKCALHDVTPSRRCCEGEARQRLYGRLHPFGYLFDASVLNGGGGYTSLNILSKCLKDSTSAVSKTQP